MTAIRIFGLQSMLAQHAFHSSNLSNESAGVTWDVRKALLTSQETAVFFFFAFCQCKGLMWFLFLSFSLYCALWCNCSMNVNCALARLLKKTTTNSCLDVDNGSSRSFHSTTEAAIKAGGHIWLLDS